MKTAEPSHMRREIEEIPHAVDRLLSGSRQDIERAVAGLGKTHPLMMATIARGSSDHAATFLKYAIELTTHLPVVSLGPSITTVYDTRLELDHAACLAISQSGRSPDLIATAKMAGHSGATIISVTNNADSPLAELADCPIDMCAGPELSVAATKTFVNSIVAGLMLVAVWKKDQMLINAIHQLPAQLALAVDCDWSELSHALGDRSSLFILGRGPSMAIANEAALKFKESCRVHAESYSAAEVMHGPATMIDGMFPVLALSSRDASEPMVVEAAEQFNRRSSPVFVTSDKASASLSRLPFVAGDHPFCDALLLIVPFYAFVESHARLLGQNPDRPPNLNKVTETV